MLAKLINLHDVRVLNRSTGLGLGEEAHDLLRSGPLGRKHHLHRNQSVEVKLPGLVNYSHSAGTEFLQDLEAGNGEPISEPSNRRGSEVSGLGAVKSVD